MLAYLSSPGSCSPLPKPPCQSYHCSPCDERRFKQEFCQKGLSFEPVLIHITHTQTHTHTHTHTQTHTHKHTHKHTQTHTQIHTYAHTHTHTQTHTQTHTNTHICTHTHTHTNNTHTHTLTTHTTHTQIMEQTPYSNDNLENSRPQQAGAVKKNDEASLLQSLNVPNPYGMFR